MMTIVRSWFNDNQALVSFLAAQTIAFCVGAISLVIYMTNLEARVVTLEIRGSPHLAEINNRLTVLESTSRDNKLRLERIIDVMTKELHIAPMRDK